jgi:hypothetical protein
MDVIVFCWHDCSIPTSGLSVKPALRVQGSNLRGSDSKSEWPASRPTRNIFCVVPPGYDPRTPRLQLGTLPITPKNHSHREKVGSRNRGGIRTRYSPDATSDMSEVSQTYAPVKFIVEKKSNQVLLDRWLFHFAHRDRGPWQDSNLHIGGLRIEVSRFYTPTKSERRDSNPRP